MDPMELLKLLGIVIVVVGFACKLDSILVIMVAAVVTALVAGMDPVSFLETMGSSFVSNRSMCVFIMTFVITGTLERNGLKQAAAALMNKFKGATAGMVLAAYGVFRVVFAAFNMLFVGGAGALLVQNTLEPLGYHVELIGLASVAVAPAIIATIAAIVYYQVLDRKDTKRYHSEQLSMDGDK